MNKGIELLGLVSKHASDNETKIAIIRTIGNAGAGINLAIEACAKSNDTVLIQSNDRGVEIININEVNRSSFAPEPMMIKNYRNDLATPFIEPTNQKKFRKKNNRKHNKRRK